LRELLLIARQPPTEPAPFVRFLVCHAYPSLLR
jgi:hypothetical protein